jgi:ketosteroid isomerase-like protein
VSGGQPIEELTRRAFSLWNDRDLEELLEMFEPEAVWDMRPAEIPGMGEYRGHDAIRRWFGQWLEVFPDSDVEVRAVEVRGEWGMASIQQSASGGSSGAAVEFSYWGVGHWRDGRLTFVENFMDPDLTRAAFERHAQDPLPSEQAQPAPE